MAPIGNALFRIKLRANGQPPGDGDILSLPPPPPVFRRSPPGYLCWKVEPFHSLNKLCKIDNYGKVWVLTKPDFSYSGTLEARRKPPSWCSMDWEIQENEHGVISTKYSVEKLYGTTVTYIDPIDTQNFSLVRARFSSISLYFILKLKTIGPKIRNKIWQKNVWNAIMPDTIYFSNESKAENRSIFGLFFSNVIHRRLLIKYLFDKDGIELIFR